jgi:hypothetical protein
MNIYGSPLKLSSLPAPKEGGLWEIGELGRFDMDF